MQFFQCITDFIFVEHEPEKADIIFVPGGNYPDAAVNAARLYREGYAPCVLPSGKYSIVTGHFEEPGGASGISAQSQAAEYGPASDFETRTKSRGERTREGVGGRRYDTECDYLCDILLREGVPEAAIIREDQATFTYENAIYSRKKTDELGMTIRRAILSCQAFHARRSLMYYQEQFPQTEFLVCPVVTRGISRESWYRTEAGIDTVLGEVERCGGQFHEIMKSRLSD